MIDSEGISGLEKFEVTKIKERPIVKTQVTIISKNLEQGLDLIYKEVVNIKKQVKIILYALASILSLCFLAFLIGAGVYLKA